MRTTQQGHAADRLPKRLPRLMGKDVGLAKSRTTLSRGIAHPPRYELRLHLEQIATQASERSPQIGARDVD